MNDRVGQKFANKYGTEFIIVEYIDNTKVIVEFLDNNHARVKTNYAACRKGQVKNPYDKTVYGIGYIGLDKNNNKLVFSEREKKVWNGMMDRCYGKRENNPSYEGCTVCERWLCFANFLEDLPLIDGYKYWLENPNKRVCLDKDIKKQGNKVYSLENCMFVTNKENTQESNRRNGYVKEEKPIICIEIKTGKITRFNSTREAERQLGIASSNICACLKGRQNTAKGFKFKYVES